MSKVKSPLKYAGGKYYLADKIVDLMPLHTTYVEPFAGGLNVLFAKSYEGISEIVNDIDSRLTNFWQVLRQPFTFDIFKRKVEGTPFSESVWKGCNNSNRCNAIGCVSCAYEFFVDCRMSLGGMCKTFAPITKNRTRRGMNEQVSAWLSAVEGLEQVHNRIKRILVLNRDFRKVLQEFNHPSVLIYQDPSYVHKTRTSKKLYKYEMSDKDHKDLLELNLASKSKILLSGYDNQLYNDTLKGWDKVSFELPNNASLSKKKRRMIEYVWKNY